MYCSGCGQPVETNEQFCRNCGRTIPQITPGAPIAPGIPGAPWFYTRVHRHLQALSVLWIAYGILTIVTWALAMSFFGGWFHGYFGHMHHGPFGEFPFNNFSRFVPFITAMVIARAVLCFATGIALHRRTPWARILALVVAFLTLIKPILGTALAIYTLWVLLPSPSAQEYEQMAGV
ncbi:MAG: zinc ribbon domain-containing protein [Silvibacterium sp.]|nr:zinc ribbon domain-containing protein [Silvibacterium sp.]